MIYQIYVSNFLCHFPKLFLFVCIAMWTVRIPKRNVPNVFSRSLASGYVCRQESRAQYPPIVDLKPEPTLLRQELSDHEKIRNLSTIEEKSIGINMPRFD